MPDSHPDLSSLLGLVQRATQNASRDHPLQRFLVTAISDCWAMLLWALLTYGFCQAVFVMSCDIGEQPPPVADAIFLGFHCFGSAFISRWIGVRPDAIAARWAGLVGSLGEMLLLLAVRTDLRGLAEEWPILLLGVLVPLFAFLGGDLGDQRRRADWQRMQRECMRVESALLDFELPGRRAA